MLATPPSSIETVLALTTGRAIPASGTRVPREAVAGGVGHGQLRQASSTVEAVVRTCWCPVRPARCPTAGCAAARSSDCPDLLVGRGVKDVVAIAHLEPLSRTMSITRDFMVVMVCDAPSTSSVTVLLRADGVPTGGTECDERRRGHPRAATWTGAVW